MYKFRKGTKIVDAVKKHLHLKKPLCRFECVKDDTQTLNTVILALRTKPHSKQLLMMTQFVQ